MKPAAIGVSSMNKTKEPLVVKAGVSTKKKNDNPEKLVERDILHWAAHNGCQFEVFDSKATFSKAAGRYKKSKSAKTGTPDMIGSNDLGEAMYVEIKAPGKGHECYLEQKNFLTKVIESNCFGAVVSSAETLDDLYSTWRAIRRQDLAEARIFLLRQLPVKIKKRYPKRVSRRGMK